MKIKIITIIISAVIILIAVLLFLGRKVDVKTNKSVTNLSDEMQEIFYLGSLAPNSHNIQSWEVVVYPKEECVVISADPNKALNVVDPKNREIFISLGCYAKTLMKSFEAYGYNTDYSFDELNKDITIKYHKSSEMADYDLTELIKKRHTDKRAFENRQLTVSDFKNAYTDLNSVYYYDSGSSSFEVIKQSTLDAYTAQANNREVAAELSKWLRLSNSETTETKDGLPAEQLGISGIKKSLYYLTTSHKSAMGDSFAKQGISTTQKQLEGCSGFVVISSGDSERELVECGMNTVELWLALTESGISVQPMSYAIEEKENRTALQTALNIDNIQMILRIGYTSEYGCNAGIRRDLADYISVK